MTITSPSIHNTSNSMRGRRHAMVVPSASTWDGGLPPDAPTIGVPSRTLGRGTTAMVEDSGGTEVRKDAMASVILGVLFGLTLTFGVAMGAQQDSFEQQPMNSFSVGASSFNQ